jgi:capsid protein
MAPVAVEAQYFSAPWDGNIPNSADGIEFDAAGNPTIYNVLKQQVNPAFQNVSDWSRVNARFVAHWFRRDRPGQHRGLSEIAPALPKFAMLRRYALAVLASAETAADFAMFLQADAGPDGTIANLDPMDLLDIERNMMTVLPEGWKMGQSKAEQPITGYREYVDAVLNEIARCLNMPFNVAAANSAGYNYSSGNLDHQVYFRQLEIERADLVRVVLMPMWRMWLREAVLAGAVPRSAFGIPVVWGWDGLETMDPVKQAVSNEMNLNNLSTNLRTIYGKRGQDWEPNVKQALREKKMIADGLRDAGIEPTVSNVQAMAQTLMTGGE